MSEQVIKYESVKQLVKAIYEGWKSQPAFLEDVRTLTETEFNAKNHHGLGQNLRNAYIHKKNTSIYYECVFLQYVEPDDCSWYMISELYKYAKGILEPNKEKDEAINGIDYNELFSLYPATMQRLKEWFSSRNGTNNSHRVIEHNNEIILVTENFNVTLNIRDLYYFFDSIKMSLFVVPHVYPKCFFVFQSPKNQKSYEEVYENRETAELAMFKEAFRISEIFLSKEV